MRLKDITTLEQAFGLVLKEQPDGVADSITILVRHAFYIGATGSLVLLKNGVSKEAILQELNRYLDGRRSTPG